MKIRFTTDHKVKQGDGKGPEYKAGEIHSFVGGVAETYARKYLARGLAVVAVDEPKPAAVVEEKPEVVVHAEAEPAQSDLQPERTFEQPRQHHPRRRN